jgi:XapX domain-containing protein
MLTIVLGVLVGLLICAGCRWSEIPVPSPPTLVGALVVVAMTVGDTASDRFQVPVITRDQGPHAKPDPDLFLAAADRLGVLISGSIAVGDSV